MEKINYLDHIDPNNEMQRHYLAQLHLTTQQIRDMDDWDDEQQIIDHMFEEDVEGKMDMVYEFGFETGEQFEGFYRWLIDNLFNDEFNGGISRNLTFSKNFMLDWVKNEVNIQKAKKEEEERTKVKHITFRQLTTLNRVQDNLYSTHVEIDRYNDPMYKQPDKLERELSILKLNEKSISAQLLSQWGSISRLADDGVINDAIVEEVLVTLYEFTEAVDHLYKHMLKVQEKISITFNIDDRE